MPRNAAKKTNKNAKRLPVLIKLSNINLHTKKKKKVNCNKNQTNSSNKSFNNNNSSSNGSNSNSNIKDSQQQQIKKKRKNIRTKKATSNGNETFTGYEIKQNNCYSNISNNSASDINETVNFDKNPNTQPANEKSEENFENPSQDLKQTTEGLLKYFSQLQTNFSSAETEEQLKLSDSNIVQNQDDFNTDLNNCKTFKETNLTLLIETEETTDKKASATEIVSLTTVATTSPLPSPNSSISSLYPIVIETSSETFLQEQHDDKDKEHQHKQQHQQQGEQNNLNTNNNNNKRKKFVHSINNNCNNSNSSSNNNSCTYCLNTAVDTFSAASSPSSPLKQLKSQNNCSKRHNNNNNNSNKPKQTSLSLTLNQSQEVKARLATLRTRKKVLPLELNKSELEKTQDSASSAEAAATEPSTEKDCDKSEESKDLVRSLAVRYFVKKVSPVLDNVTLNLIETLSDEVKKPNNKRKRNNATAVLLGLATLHQPRSSKRFALSNLSKTPAALNNKTLSPSAGGSTTNTVANKNEQNFLKPLPLEAPNTNSKKRARIMSLYERPFQTANDGRGSVVGNGYMTSSRSSNSSGGAGGGALVMNDTNDSQDMANQYYLSGTSGSGIAGNSNPSLVGNGSAINHAPTMGTLCNIGNTCYLNSVVYTLRFAPQFLHNLHHLLADLNALQQNIARARAKSSSLGRGISAVHMENARSWSSKDLASMEQYATGAVPVAGTNTMAAANSTSSALTHVTQKSSHQLLTEKLHELYQSLHRNEINESTEPHHADTLLHAIQDVSSIFEGNQQQDAHEFLMCLLNSIRETSQTLIKAIAECPDVILNGYISNPDEIERDLMKNLNSGGSTMGSGLVSSGSSNNSNSLASASSKTSSFFSRKSKRKDESKNSKNSRLQSPLKDALLSGNTQTSTANSLFYLNTNDLNTSTNAAINAATPASTSGAAGATGGGSLTSPSSSSSNVAGAVVVSDETDAPTAVALILKDKQRLEGKIRELGLDFFNEDFEGITVSTTKCLSCETITEQKETMIDIAVPVPQDGYEGNEFRDRPSSFIQNSCITREYFNNDNKYRCEQCCGYTEAIRSISYEVLPRLLIIQLSRFSGGMEKINSYIPTSFTLQCFCSKCCKLSDANKLHIYKLYSVITHVGATMSVGHYIAYTCSLDWANEYINCPKEQRRRASQERNAAAAGNGSSASGTNSTQNTGSTGLGSTSTGFMKMKMKFGRSKASSSGDMSKNVKQLNGLNSSSKAITNGIGKLSMNNSSSGGGGGAATPQCPVTCQSINCCAMRLTAQQQLQYQSANNSTSDFSEESSQYSNGSGYNATTANYNNNLHHPYSSSNNTSGYGSTGRGSTKASYATTQNNCSEPIWYMCDDDKIKAMTQREFEELLSPARKITITPYLLFYARYNLQSTPPKSATVSSSSPGPVTSSPQTSWSNESLQSSGHSAHSSGMRM